MVALISVSLALSYKRTYVRTTCPELDRYSTSKQRVFKPEPDTVQVTRGREIQVLELEQTSLLFPVNKKSDVK